MSVPGPAINLALLSTRIALSSSCRKGGISKEKEDEETEKFIDELFWTFAIILCWTVSIAVSLVLLFCC